MCIGSGWKKTNLRIVLPKRECVRVVEMIHRIVENGKLGEDYTIVNREKNRRLRREYNVNDAKIRKILLGLQVEDFIKAERSNHPEHEDDVVYIFKKKILLMPRWQENADYASVMLYIKIVLPVENTMMLIISFHEDNI